VKVTAQDGTTTSTYTITVTRAASLSNVATLSGLTLSSGTLSPGFATGTTSYTASVLNDTSTVTVTPTRTEANATIQVRVNAGSYAAVTSGSASGSLSLNVGSNTINVLVTAQDGTTTATYTITVTRHVPPVTCSGGGSITITNNVVTGNTSCVGTVVVPVGVTGISTGALNSASITKIELSKTVASIGFFFYQQKLTVLLDNGSDCGVGPKLLIFQKNTLF
jgi:hypothetical protein